MSRLAPVIVFVYNRPNHTRKTLEALSKNYLAAESDLYIFCDGAKNSEAAERVNDVRKIADGIGGFKSVTITKRDKNLGLANSVITGVSEVIKKHGKVIVVEEDLISSPNFLDFANQSLDKYESVKNVFSIAGYTYNIELPENYKHDNYFTPRCESLGWGTWIDRWEKADWQMKDFDNFLHNSKERKNFGRIGEDLVDMLINQMAGKVDSWAVRWCYSHYKNNAYCSYPAVSKIIHIGDDKHSANVKRKVKFLETPLDEGSKRNFNFLNKAGTEDKILSQYRSIFKKSFLKKITRLIRTKIL